MADRTFGYRATLESGQELVGTLNATDESAARQALENLKLTVLQIWPAGAAQHAAPLGPDDFRSFNQQLAMLVKAGLPLEAGLDLLATESGSRKQNKSLAAINADLKGGMSLADAVARHGRSFPPDYAMLLEAGVKSNNLSQVLTSLGEHLDMRQKLRESLFQAIGYPAFVLAAMIGVGAFMGWYVYPLFQRFATSYSRSGSLVGSTALKHEPWPTALLLLLGRNTNLILGGITVVIAAGIVVWLVVRKRPIGLTLRDWAAENLPILGPAVRAGLIARWCNGLRLGVTSGMDLPAAIELAGAVTGSPMIIACGSNMNFAIARGLPIDKAVAESALPPTIGVAIQAGIAGNNLPETLAVLSDGYSKEARTRIAALPAILTPILLILLSLIVVLVFFGLTGPFIRLLSSLTG
jgi:general secretion pathway protein F